MYASVCLWEYCIPHTPDETYLIHLLLLRASVLCSCSLACPHVAGASTWRSAPVQATACDPSLGNQPPATACTAPVQAPRRELQAASTASPMQLDASSFSSCSYRGPPPFLFVHSLLFHTSAMPCAFQEPYVRPGGNNHTIISPLFPGSVTEILVFSACNGSPHVAL